MGIECFVDLEKFFGGRFKGDFEVLVWVRFGEVLGGVVF